MTNYFGKARLKKIFYSYTNPNNKNKSLDCYEIAKIVSENTKACQQAQQ